MGRVHVRRITLQAFRAFQNRQSSPILPMTGLVGIRGKDVITGVSSGSGKSSVPLAITYAFGYCPFPATEQQNWDTNTPMQVELELSTEQGPAILRRGKEFSLTVNGVKTEGSAKLVEQELVKLTGLPTPLLEALTYRQQQERGRFLSMKDSEKKEFLSTLLGVNELEEQIATSVTTSNKLQAEVESMTQVVAALRAQLSKPEEPKLPSTEALEQQLAEAEAQLAAHSQTEEVVMERLKACQHALDEVFKRPEPTYVANTDELERLESQLAEANKRLDQLTVAENAERWKLVAEADALTVPIQEAFRFITSLAAEDQKVVTLEREIQHLENDSCPTCKRQWDGADTLLSEKRAALTASKLLLSKRTETMMDHSRLLHMQKTLEQQARDYLHPNREKMQQVVQHLKNQIVAERVRIDGAKTLVQAQHAAETARLADRLRTPLTQAQLDVDEYYELADSLNQEIQSLHQQINHEQRLYKSAMESYSIQLGKYESFKRDIEKREAELAEKQRKQAEEADYAAALKSYLGSLFDEVLAQISAEANELLRSVPNAPTTTITFVSESVTAKGVVRQEIRPIITKNGHEASLRSGISGGQLESVELAVDLSIAKVIGQRTGVRPGFMIFDESFSAHCMPVKEACMHILQKAAEDCLILVVDHSSELRDYFSAFIDVESEHDVSRFAIPS